MNRIVSLLVVALFTLSANAFADEAGQGCESVVADDGYRRVCVDARTDEVSIRLVRAVVGKDKSWFSNDRTVDMIIDGKIQKTDAHYNRTAAEMPVSFRARIGEYDAGTVVVPVDTQIVSPYRLSLGGHTTNLIELNFDFVNSSEPTALTRVISKLPQAIDGLPIPVGPFTPSFMSAASVVGSLVDAFLGDEEFDGDVSRQGRISMELNATGKCGRNGIYSGLYVFMKSYDQIEHEGIIKLSEIPHYCFVKFENMSPIFIEEKAGDGSCTYDQTKAVRLLNPHFSIMVSIANVASQDIQSRDILESTLKQVVAPEKAGWNTLGVNIDQHSLKAAYTSAEMKRLADGFEGNFYKLAETGAGSKSYPKWTDSQLYNQLVKTGVAAGGGGLSREISPLEIKLNSVSRCMGYGLEVYECF